MPAAVTYVQFALGRMASIVLAGCTLVLMLLANPTTQARCYEMLSQQDFKYCRMVDGTFALHWDLGEDSVTFGLHVDQTNGWIGMGLSEGGSMRGADVYVFSKDTAGVWEVTDSYLEDDDAVPKEDLVKDVELLSVEEAAGSTAITFTRKLETCDVEHDQIIHPTELQAYILTNERDWNYHSPNSTALFLRLAERTGNSSVNSEDDGTQLLTLQMPNYTVPTARTTIACVNFEVPSQRTFHIIGHNFTAGRKQEQSRNNSGVTTNALVHTMLLFACDSKPSKPVGEVFDCLATPPECAVPVALWAPGQQPEDLPPNTGFRFGEGSYQHFMLQVQYVNPGGEEGTQDSSGLVLRYTPNLRQHDLGIMLLGSERFTIPPGHAAASLPPAICPSECSSKFTSDLHITSVAYHMNQLGAQMLAQRLAPSTAAAPTGTAAAPTGTAAAPTGTAAAAAAAAEEHSRSRNGTGAAGGRHVAGTTSGRLQEVTPLGYRKPFDFDWQGATLPLPGSETWDRGSAIMTTCTFNTLSRTSPTSYGPGALEEECYLYVRYWPQQKIDRCLHLPGTEHMFRRGFALTACYQTSEVAAYILANGVDMYRPEGIQELLDKGFLMQYNMSRYQDYLPLSNASAASSPTCAARQAAGDSSGNAAGNGTGAGAVGSQQQTVPVVGPVGPEAGSAVQPAMAAGGSAAGRQKSGAVWSTRAGGRGGEAAGRLMGAFVTAAVVMRLLAAAG